jgi:hypothetical protein
MTRRTDRGKAALGCYSHAADPSAAERSLRTSRTHLREDSHRAPDELVFCTGKGTSFNRSNVRQRILGAAIEAANNKLKQASKPPVAGDHEPYLSENVRLAALRGRRLACVRDGADGAHELGAGARGLCPQDGPPAPDGSADGRADSRR